MPAIDFPAAPAVNDEYSFEGRTWRWNGTGWEVKEYPAALLAGTAANPSLYFSGDPNTGLYSPGADQVAISTGGTGRLFVDASGNVGVGASAIAKFTSFDSGTSYAGMFRSGTGSSLVVFGNTGTPNAYFQGIGATGENVVVIAGNAERLRITSAGLVGIGTSSPSDILSVQKTDTSNSLFDSNAAITITNSNSDVFGRSTNLNFNQGSDASSGRIASIAGVYTNYSTSVGGALAFSTSNGSGTVGERLRITSAGNVGIGTTTPDTALHINGTFDSSSAFATTNSNKGLTINSSLGDATGVQYGVVFSTSQNSNTDYPVAGIMAIPVAPSNGIGGSLSFQTHTSADTTLAERARIDSSGRLLVGTSTSKQTNGAKLEIVGTRAANGIYEIALHEDAIHPLMTFSKGAALVSSGDGLGEIGFFGHDGVDKESEGARITAEVDGTPGANDMPGRLVFFTTADGAASPTERLRITSAGVLQIADAGNIAVGTTTGTKIGTATTQKLGFYNKTPVVQPAAVADATDAASVITQLNALLARMRDLGLIAT